MPDKTRPRIPLGAFGLFLALSALAPAQTTPASAAKESGVRLEFVPPPIDGKISLGIYESKGKLIRTLCVEMPVADFKTGLNGLITSWDGKDDEGARAPEGKYSARGYMVADATVEGEAFRCNDWVSEETSCRIARIREIRAPASGGLVATAKGVSGNFLFRCDAAGKIMWCKALPADITGDALAVNQKTVFAGGGKGLMVYDLSSGGESTWQGSFDGIAALSAGDNYVAVVAGPTIRRFSLPDRALQATEDAGRPISAISEAPGSSAILSRGALLVKRGDGWKAIELGAGVNAIDLCVTATGAVWTIARTHSSSEVREYALDGAFQRRLAVVPEEPAPIRVAAAGNSDTVFLLEENETEQRARALQLTGSEPPANAGGEIVSKWKVTLAKEIFFSDEFIGVRNKLSDAAGVAFKPDETMKLSLPPNPLLADQATTISVQLSVDGRGTVMRLPDGLPLRRLTEAPALRWAVGRLDSSGKSLTFFQGDGAVVEEFKADNVANMMSFDCGEFVLTPDK